MKIAISGISHSDSHVNGTAHVEHDYLIAPVNLCSIPVSVDYVEGKSLEQYAGELREKALGIIKTMHDELGCGGFSVKVISKDGKLFLAGLVPEPEPPVKEFCASEIFMNECHIKPTELSKELLDKIEPASGLEERVAALEEKLSGGVGPSAVKKVHDICSRSLREAAASWNVSKDPAGKEEGSRYSCALELSINNSEPSLKGRVSDVPFSGFSLNKEGSLTIKAADTSTITELEKHPDNSFELSVTGIFSINNSPYMTVSVSCLSGFKCEVLSLNIKIERDDKKDIHYYESLAIEKARYILKQIALQI